MMLLAASVSLAQAALSGVPAAVGLGVEIRKNSKKIDKIKYKKFKKKKDKSVEKL
jgi:hypothetical protein